MRQKITWQLDGRTALDCYVLEPGRIRIGDPVEVGELWTLPRAVTNG